jgi:riboflavin kinase/FMN adenylyltransferase
LVCTIGFFDGVHRGHQWLIQQVKAEAHCRSDRSLLITFDRHPRSVFAPESAPLLLTSMGEKMSLLRATGVDDIFILPFDRAMAALTAREFMEQVLKKQLGVSVLVIGYDHHFGRPQGETFEDYKAYGQQLGIDVVLAQELPGEHVSSSVVRHALEAGDVRAAAQLLGRPYIWTGRVVHGHAVGHKLGFPTANLQLAEDGKLVPGSGVYAVKVKLEGLPDLYHGMMNIGSRPTFGGHCQTLETHLFHFDSNIYGQQMTVSFVSRLRSETKFDSREALMSQLESDLHQAEAALNKESEL